LANPDLQVAFAFNAKTHNRRLFDSQLSTSHYRSLEAGGRRTAAVPLRVRLRISTTGKSGRAQILPPSSVPLSVGALKPLHNMVSWVCECISQTAFRSLHQFFAGLTMVTNRQRDRQTDRPHYMCSNRPHLNAPIPPRKPRSRSHQPLQHKEIENQSLQCFERVWYCPLVDQNAPLFYEVHLLPKHFPRVILLLIPNYTCR